MERITWEKERVGENFYQQLLKSENPQKDFLEKYDQDYSWRLGYGFYGFRMNPEEGTLTFSIGSSCE